MVTFSFWDVPFQRRLQTLSAVMWFLSGPIFAFPICVLLGFLISIFIPFVGLPLVVIYCIWALFFDTTASKGGRPIQWIRNLSIWRYFSEYFPAQLVVTEPLDPKGNYLFGYHPHGILSIGAFLSFGTEALGFSKLFPGILPRLMTLKMNLVLPFYREYIMGYGITEVSKESCVHNLTAGPGRSIVIVIGGASEALEAHPGTYNLTLHKRKGFVKVAIETGASLVPVIGFGENDLFDSAPNPHGSNLRRFQERALKIFGYSVPLFHGRGIFNYNFGLLPHRRPLTVVVGSPLKVEKCPNPSEEMVNKYHALYLESLEKLFHQSKEEYAPNRQSDLKIVC